MLENSISAELQKKPQRNDILSFTLPFILTTVQQAQNRNTFHHAGGRVAQKLAARLECAIDPNVVLGGHEKVARLGRMVGGLFRNIISTRSIRIVPVAGEGLSEDGVQGLLDASASMAGGKISMSSSLGRKNNKKRVLGGTNVRRLDVPSTQIELDHRDKALHGVVNCGHGEECFGVCHEAM